MAVFIAERTWNSYELLGFSKSLPWTKHPRALVPDNNSNWHTIPVIRIARRALAASVIDPDFLPPYRPSLNLTDLMFRDCKEIVETGHSQGRLMWTNIRAYHVSLWTLALTQVRP